MSYREVPEKMNENLSKESALTFCGDIYRSKASQFLAASPLPSDSTLDITIFMACYNEEGDIIASLEATTAALIELACSWEIIVVDDASRDNSVPLVKQYLSDHPDYPVTLVVREENQGLGQNYIEAAFLGRGKYYKFVCGDNVETSDQLVSIIGHMGEADMVIPYHCQIIGRSLFRIKLSRTFTTLVNLLSGYNIKYYNGLGVYKRFDVMRWHTNYHGFGFQADLVTRLLDQGKSYIEVPVVARERASGESKALTTKNILSVSHFFLDLAIRRVGKLYRSKSKRKSA